MHGRRFWIRLTLAVVALGVAVALFLTVPTLRYKYYVSAQTRRVVRVDRLTGFVEELYQRPFGSGKYAPAD